MASIFTLQDSGLLELQPTSFSSEDDFQKLLAEHPALLSGAEIDPESPRRWLLVRREAPIPSQQDGAGRWSIDHLFLDQDGVPTLVEVKRQSDTRIRREVVGQMLDYAANSVAYWPADDIRAHFELKNEDPQRAMLDLLGPDADTEKFWLSVKTNLQAGRVRMLFVAEQIPDELRRIIEFLNSQMDPAEVLALELRRFQQDQLQTIISAVFGKTQAATKKKAVGGTIRAWDVVAILDDLRARGLQDLVPPASRIADWISDKAEPEFGKGGNYGQVSAKLTVNSKRFTIIKLWSHGVISLNFGSFPPSLDQIKLEWHKNLAAINGFLPKGVTPSGYPEVKLVNLKDEAALESFLSVMTWLVEKLSASRS